MAKSLKKNRTLGDLEQQVEVGGSMFYDGCLVIHETEKWREVADTVEQYASDRWGWSRARWYQIISAAQVQRRCLPMVDKPIGNERHLRALSKAPEKEQPKIAASVLEACELAGRKPTTKDWTAAVKPFVEEKPKAKPKAKPKEPKPEFNPSAAQVEINKLIKALNNDSQVDILRSIRDVLLLIVPLVEEHTVIGNPSATFDAFWQAYPPTNRRSQGDAKKAWKSAVKKACPEIIISAAAEYARSMQGQSDFCPGPTPWLNQERWADNRESWNRTYEKTPQTFQSQKTRNTVDAVTKFMNNGQERIENG